jgi:hypothetical protein
MRLRAFVLSMRPLSKFAVPDSPHAEDVFDNVERVDSKHGGGAHRPRRGGAPGACPALFLNIPAVIPAEAKRRAGTHFAPCPAAPIITSSHASPTVSRQNKLRNGSRIIAARFPG